MPWFPSGTSRKLAFDFRLKTEGSVGGLPSSFEPTRVIYLILAVFISNETLVFTLQLLVIEEGKLILVHKSWKKPS